MSTEKARYSLEKLKTRYIFLRLVEIILLAVATALLTKAIANLVIPTSPLMIFLAIIAGAVVLFTRLSHYRLLNLTSDFFASYLNKTYPQLKESADLLTRDDENLTTLQQLQKTQTLNQFNILYPEIRLPNHILQSAGILSVCVIAYFLLSSFKVTNRTSITEKKRNTFTENSAGINDTTTSTIRSLTIVLTPPVYTRLKAFTSPTNNLIFPEGSMVNWRAEFTNEVTSPKIIFSGRDSSSLVNSSRVVSTFQKKINESGFYQVQWSYKSKIYRSDYFKIEVIKDQPPKAGITNLAQFTRLRFADNLTIDVNASLADDYGLDRAHIIATVSKGSGESVKFREEKLFFTNPSRISGKQVNATLTLDLLKLGLEPGDELYFYAEAFDNKTPVPNHHRTETFFIALQDTAAEVTTIDQGLGVDLLPEYFRSQRQIIIDTEKLLKERKLNQVTTKEFNATSNELGYDQKVLRLRYGQFMGEEADSGIGIEAAAGAVEESEHEKDEKDIMKQYGHDHDTENEHNLVDQKKESHDHGGIKDPGEKEDPLKDFIHQHDNSEEATFLFQSVRAKLKAALSLMWDSELQLRLYQPAKSLPYQYQALKLLKEISNDSRIYVHRSGFDPPPLKEDKRLTADLTEIRNMTNRYINPPVQRYPGIRLALTLTEKMIQENSSIVPSESQRIFTLAGQELSLEAIEQPGLYLRSLSLLRTLANQEVKPEDMKKILLEVRKTLWTVIPPVSISPSVRPAAIHMLDQKFLESLKGRNE